LEITEDTKGSHHSFKDIVNFGKELLCEGLGEECDINIINTVWSSTWEEAQIILHRAGYKNQNNNNDNNNNSNLFVYIEFPVAG